MNVKLLTGLVENYDAVYVERKNQNCLWLKGFIREMSKIQIKKYRFLSDIRSVYKELHADRETGC